MSGIFNKLDAVVRRFEDLTTKMADSSLYNNQEEMRKVTVERSNLEEIVNTYRIYKKTKETLEGAKEILQNEKDEELRTMAKEEAAQSEKDIERLEQELKILLLPKDPLDNKNVIVEIRAGAGGTEAGIFVG